MAAETAADQQILGRASPINMSTPLQWTEAEPEGLSDLEWATALGATWESDELVTYDLAALRRAFEQSDNQYLEDSD